MPKRKILVAGASGLVGFAAVQHFARLPDWEVVGVSRRIPPGLEGATLLSVDLSDQARCAEVFGRMSDVTHVVYAALYEKPGLVQGWRERDQMETNLAMLRNLFAPLEKVAKNLQHVSLLQGTKAYGVHLEPFPVPARERWPRHQHENFYWLQEDYLRERQQGKEWHWTVWRPQLILGESLGSQMNVIPAIGVYAALRREAGLPLSFPGGASFVLEAIDADILARACAWATTTPASHNEIFNVTNGDVFVWPNVWPAIADALGFAPGEHVPLRLDSEIRPQEAAWTDIRAAHGLKSGTLKEFVGLSFEYADYTMGYGRDRPGPPAIVSTIKLMQAGFCEVMDTEMMFRRAFAEMQAKKLLPPR